MFVENVLCKMRIEHGAGRIRIFLRRHGKDCEEVLTIENCGMMPFIRKGDVHFKVDCMKVGLDVENV